MARLVRGKVKPLEFAPEWAKCCEAMAAAIKQRSGEGVFIFDLDSFAIKEFRCADCKADHKRGPHLAVAEGPEMGAVSHIELLDLDEAPYVPRAGEIGKG